MILYSFFIHALALLYKVASIFHTKAKLFVDGRQAQKQPFANTFDHHTHKIIWIHSASLGEFEQGRPVIESLKSQLPNHKVLLTFFSPSGYEVRKKYPLADWVFYLPWDTQANAHRWVENVNPVMAIFIKYEFWLNYSRELFKRKIPTVSISSIFRPNQLFFKRYGGFYRQLLKNFNYFFVQNNQSKELLNSIGITNAEVTGDTRFDRVFEIAQQAQEIEIAKKFKGSRQVMVVGSCWEEDFDLLCPFLNDQQGNLKFILAPHEIKEGFLSAIEKSFNGKSIRFSQVGDLDNLDACQLLLIDNIGMLSHLYQYGEFAYVGGGFGKGIHNILEAAAFGIPVFFGNKNYMRFNEANELIKRGGAFELGSYYDLKKVYGRMAMFPESFLLACEANRHYVTENVGATKKIVSYCKQMLD